VYQPDDLLLQLCLTLIALDCVKSSMRVPLRVCLLSIVLAFWGSQAAGSFLMPWSGHTL